MLDLAILIARTKVHFKDAYRLPHFYDKENPTLDRIGLQGDALTIAVCEDNEYIDEDMQLFEQVLKNDNELLSERLKTLSKLLQEAGY